MRSTSSRPDGRFTPSPSNAVFAADSVSEDVAAVFFDANGDRHPDLYVVSGGNEFSELASALQDRLYLNDGHGQFHKAEGSLPTDGVSGSHVVAEDYDGDGDIDLFVGGRVVPWKYGANPQSMLLQNDGRGHFTDVTSRLAPELARVGMVTDAVWRDVDGDGRKDLVVVGEWMPITIFHNAGGGRLTPMTVPGLEHSAGWWNRIVAGDFTGDGKVDFIVGNAGLNSRCHASADGTRHDVREGLRPERLRRADRVVLQPRRELPARAPRRSDQDAADAQVALPELQGLRDADRGRHVPEVGAGRRHLQVGGNVRDDARSQRRRRKVHAHPAAA